MFIRVFRSRSRLGCDPAVRLAKPFAPTPGLVLLALLATLGVPWTARAQSQAPATGTVHGRTTTQETVVLPGVVITLLDKASGKTVAETSSDEQGEFELRTLRAGSYLLRAALADFATVDQGLTLVTGQVRQMDVDLPLGRTEQVDVIGQVEVEATRTATQKEVVAGNLTDLAPLAGDNFQALLPVLPGVVRASDGRLNLKGGRSNESGLQVGNAVVTDPVTGEWGFNLPPEAVVSVDVQANPYDAQLGRFQAGVATIATRQGSNAWRFAANGLVPIPRIRDWKIRGIGSFGPRLSLSGAPVKDRLFLHQSARYQLLKTRVASQPDPHDDRVLHEFESFTRLDVNVSARHALTGTLAMVAPWRMDYATLDTFNPREVTPTVRRRGYTADVSSRSTFGTSTLLDTSVVVRQFDADVFAQGPGAMEIGVEGNSGNYFNEQSRHTRSVQASATATLARNARGEHLLKLGADVLGATFEGRSVSRPVIVRRADGSRSQAIEYSGPTEQSLASTDVALFAHDRWRASDRLLVELGARADRDGVTREWGVGPRLGASLSVLPGGQTVVRGGAGIFYGRTPLNVGAFESYEAQRVTWFGPDGRTPLAAPLTFVHRATRLETPRSLTWNVELDHRLTSSLTLRLNHLRRDSEREYVVEPIVSAGAAALELASRGQSRYRETEVTLRYGPRPGLELVASYVRARSRANLNSLDTFVGNVRKPIIRADEYGTTPTDVPNRVLLRGEVPLSRKWSISPLVEIRNGFPFSLIDENQDFVGPRNAGGRFPTLYMIDLGVNRLITIRNRETWIGIRVYHLLNTFAPRDVQNNIDSPAFGSFYNSILHKAGLNFYIHP